MREMMRMDLLLNRVTLGVNIMIVTATIALLASMGVDSDRALAGFAGLMAAVFPVTIITREDKSKTMALSCSLPVTRRTIVRARYLLSVALIALGVLLVLGVAALMPTSRVSAAALFGPGSLLTAFAFALIVASVMLPLTLRLGAIGLIVLLVVFQVIGVALLTVVQVTGSSADKRILHGIGRAIAHAATALGPVGFRLALLAALAALLALSYRASVFFFERREL